MSESITGARHWQLPDEAATTELGKLFARSLDRGLVIYLHGPLGAGKTSFARSLLMSLGVGERVKSPTYSLMEGYVAGDQSAWHLDLYRIADPAELEWLGLDALADPAAIVLVEWPERGVGALPAADLQLHFDYDDDGRSATLEASSQRGHAFAQGLPSTS